MTKTKSQKLRQKQQRLTAQPKQPAKLKVATGPSNAPIAHQVTRKTPAPRVANTREGCVVSHREFIADVTRTTNNFTLDSYSINPGLAGTFPWLAQVASRFESYTFDRLDFIFEPMVATTQPGSIMMAIDFDASDTPPGNKTTLMAMQGAMRSAPWQAYRMSASAIDRRKMVPERYTRSGAPATGSDIKTLDVGNLFVSTVGTGTTTVLLGEIHVEYTVRLRTPQIQTAPGLSIARRALQTGTFVLNVASGVTSNVANVVGEGPTPLFLAGVNANTRSMFVHPSIRRFLLMYQAVLSGGSLTTSVQSIFNNPTNSGIRFWDEPTQLSSNLARLGRLSLGPQKAGASGETLIIETLAATEPDPEFVASSDNNRGQAMTSWPMLLRSLSTYSSATNITVDYTLIPLENEPWPMTAIPFLEENTGMINTVTVWPNDAVIIPAKGYRDGINVITYNVKEQRPLPPMPTFKK